MHCPEILVLIYVSLLVTVLVREQCAAKSLEIKESVNWDELVFSLRAVRTAGLRRLAIEAVTTRAFMKGRIEQPGNIQTGIGLVGGIGGLERLSENSKVLIALSRYPTGLSNDQIQSITMMRRQSLELRSRASAIRALSSLQCGGKIIESYTRRVAYLYCEIVTQLLDLYSAVHISRVERLVAACNW